VLLVSARRVNVEFDTHLPMGTVGRFTIDKERWIALPQAKYGRLLAVIDRILGNNNRIRTEMLRWINHWPDDAERVVRVLDIVSATEELTADMITEKTKAVTM
jgi:hypothetical protein